MTHGLRASLAGLYLLSAALGFAQDVGPSRMMDDSYFGMHIHRAAAGTAWPSVQFGSWRLWDSMVTWRDLEPFKGYWRFETLDRLVSLAEQRGVSVLLTLGVTPVWASARPEEGCWAGRGCCAEPQHLEDWENYVRTVVERYRGKIVAYELWNEVIFSDLYSPYDANGRAYFYSGTSASMIDLAQSAYRIIKEVDPSAKLVSPSLHILQRDWIQALRLYFGAGGAAYTDAVSFHFYADTPEQTLPAISAVREAMNDYGLADKPLWNTETGFVTRNDSEPQSYGGVSPEQAAGYVARSFALDAAAGVDRVYWYAWDNTIYGLSADNGQAATKAAAGYAIASEWLKDAVIRRCQLRPDEVWSCRIERGNTASMLVWRTHGPLAWRTPDEWHVSSYKLLLDSQWTAPSGQRVPVDSNPILLRIN